MRCRASAAICDFGRRAFFASGTGAAMLPEVSTRMTTAVPDFAGVDGRSMCGYEKLRPGWPNVVEDGPPDGGPPPPQATPITIRPTATRIIGKRRMSYLHGREFSLP